MEYLSAPNHFTLQWHITERCNRHCRHCYQEETALQNELELEQMIQVLDQLVFVLAKWDIPPHRAKLNITGGEPFVRKDFFHFLQEVHKRSSRFRWGLLSNGDYVTPPVANMLKQYGISNYQVSLEGLEDSNDVIRGKGAFRSTLDAIKILADAGIRTHVSLTLTKRNMGEIPKLSAQVQNAGARQLNTRRLVPIGNGALLIDDMLEPLELKEYYVETQSMNRTLRAEGKDFRVYIGCESAIFNEDSQTMKHDCGIPSGRILTLMSNGEVVACRRMPIVVGNVLKQSLFEIWYGSNKLWELRDYSNADPFCKNCRNYQSCRCGALCVTYACTRLIHVPDVQCWRYYNKLDWPFLNGNKTKSAT